METLTKDQRKQKYDRECMRGHCIYLDWLGAGMFDKENKFTLAKKKEEQLTKKRTNWNINKKRSARLDQATAEFRKSKFKLWDFCKFNFEKFRYKSAGNFFSSMQQRLRRIG